MKRAAALLLVLAACGGDNGPGPDPGAGRITFTRIGSNSLVDIYAMDLNGSNLQQLTTSFAIDADAAWSPDTFKIVFQSNRIPDSSYTPAFQIFTMKSDGSSVGQLTFADNVRDPLTNHVKDTTSNFSPAWSPDGTKIAFASSRDTASHVSHIYVMDPNGSNVVQLTNASGDDALPAWSPDGTKIAFHSDREINYAVWVMNADGSNPVRLTNPTGDLVSGGAENPSWSPDGTRIVYDDNVDIWVMNADGATRSGSRVGRGETCSRAGGRFRSRRLALWRVCKRGGGAERPQYPPPRALPPS